MMNNAGSITEEGPHLSDWEDTSSSIYTEDKEDEDGRRCENSAILSKYPVESTFSGDGLHSKLKTPVQSTTKVSSHATNDLLCTVDNLGVVKSNEDNDSNINSQNSQNKNEYGSAAPSKSIYIDDGTDCAEKPVCKVKTKPKRLTMAQQATKESLALFGGCSLSSIPVRKIDLRTELDAETVKKKRALQQDDETMVGKEPPPSKRPRTRLQAARQETEFTFKDISLSDGKRNYTTVQKLKANQFRRSNMSKVKTRQPTRVDKARIEAMDSFGGVGLDSLPVKATSNSQDTSEATNGPGRRLTRVERARLETLEAFGGGGLQDVMTTAIKRIACTLKEKDKNQEKSGKEKGDKENFGKSSEHDPVAVNDNE
ncbi:uncharacterized protein LOC135336303 isoform X3 [Halichondria panicea]